VRIVELVERTERAQDRAQRVVSGGQGEKRRIIKLTLYILKTMLNSPTDRRYAVK
jgi:hypothetical protein